MRGVSIRGLSFAYEKGPLVLKDIDLEVPSGQFVCLLGQSGCGKSTLLRLLIGLEAPTGGEILLDGEPIRGASLDRGAVFQDYGLFPWMSAGENIALALRQRFPNWEKGRYEETALRYIREVGLDETVYRKLPRELSGGMQQRCAIAQALAIEPQALLMDEPFGALDAVTRARLQDLLLGICARQEPKRTVFFVTHDVDEALLLGGRIVVLGQSPGRVIHDVMIPEERRPTRKTQFEDAWILQLRNELIAKIHEDVASRAEEDSSEA